MAGPTLTDSESIDGAHTALVELLQSSNPGDAVAYIESLRYNPEWERKWRELLAIACTEGGAACDRRDWIEKGAMLFRELGTETSPNDSYNLANAELALWEHIERHDSVLDAWELHLDHLDEARALYGQVVGDASVPASLRIQALTNSGNSLDIVGRHLDAIAKYNEALSIDPQFSMALGNRALALTYFARYMGGHERQVLSQAAADLQAALHNADATPSKVSPHSLESFRSALRRLPADLPPPIDTSPEWNDPYLRWCAQNGLFLHVWPRALSEETQYLDPLFPRRLTSPVGEAGLDRLHNLVDAFNALKQDYSAARYSLWLATDRSSPIFNHATDVSTRTLLIDSVQCARWGIRTGMLIQAHAASTNVLDKIAGFVHLYFSTERRALEVSFRWIDRSKTGRPIDAPLRAALAPPEVNTGLLALFDLSHDLTRGTALKDRVNRRHRVTHRFVVAHSIFVPESHDWVDRVETLDLINEAVVQLQTARSALIYLARAIDRHEAVSQLGSDSHGVGLPMGPVDTRMSELL